MYDDTIIQKLLILLALRVPGRDTSTPIYTTCTQHYTLHQMYTYTLCMHVHIKGVSLPVWSMPAPIIVPGTSSRGGRALRAAELLYR